MSQGLVLKTYLARTFLRWIGGTFLLCLAIIFLADFVEVLRRIGDEGEVGILAVAWVTLLRLLFFGEMLLPFAVLFGSMAAMLSLSRKLELVVTRSAGVSVWQFLRPGLLVTLLIGILAVVAYNPIASAMKQRADMLEAVYSSATGAQASRLWLRQSGGGAQSVIHAAHALDQGLTLVGVTVYRYDADGRFLERIDAERGVLESDHWLLENAIVTAADAAAVTQDSYRLDTTFTPEQVSDVLISARSVSFWSLPDFIERARAAGLPASRYLLQYQILLASPLLLITMVFIAATVSLRLFRLGNVSRMIVGGVVAGFVLYVVGRLAQDLGGSGLVHPVVAAWVPTSVALLVGLTVLLHQEDG